MKRSAACLLFVGAVSVAVPDALVAQYRPGPRSEWRWPASWSPALPTDLEQVQRLPIYDDAGAVIPFEAIASRVDPSGLRGAFWSGLLGFLGGALIGEAIKPHGCDTLVGGLFQPCSPRETALRSAWPVGLSLVGLVGAAWIGWHADATSWQEALAEIRLERRARGTP